MAQTDFAQAKATAQSAIRVIYISGPRDHHATDKLVPIVDVYSGHCRYTQS